MFKHLSFFTPNLKQGWLLGLFVILAQIPVAAIILPLMTAFPKSDFIEKTLPYILSFSIVIFYSYIIGKRNLGNSTEGIRVNQPYYGNLAPLTFFALITISSFAFLPISDAITSFLPPMPQWLVEVFAELFVGNKFIIFFTVAICAAFFEEILCRGIIMRGLLKHTSPSKAIVWSSIIFAVIHLNPWQAIAAFILGSFYGWIYYKTRIIWAPMLMHFINNGSACLLSFMHPELAMEDSLRSIFKSNGLYWLTIVICTALVGSIIFLIHNKIKRNGETEIISS